MKRRLVIIGSPLTKSSRGYLQGVKEDVKNMYNFHLSATGGAWKKEEILYLLNPTSQSIYKILSWCNGVDFASIIYSGHGFMRDGQNYININENEKFNVSGLRTTAKRQFTMIDACRTNYPYEHADGLYGIDFQFDMTNLDLARKMYDFYISKTPEGHITIFSSSPNQASQDTSEGGAYTVSLLRSLINWSDLQTSTVLNVKDAFTRSKHELSNISRIQSPQLYAGDEKILQLPFAINPALYLKINQKPNQSLPSQQKSTSSLAGIVFKATAVGLLLWGIFGKKE